jgi:HPt (histidine-containing phosphotransfer) domain-containing protein
MSDTILSESGQQPDAGVPFDGQVPTPDQSRSNAIEAMGGDASLLAAIAPHFGGAASAQLSSLREALAKQDAAQVRHWSHTLKGTLLTVGANRSSTIAARIEKTARDGKVDGLQPWVERLAAETEVLIDHLDSV